MNTQVAKVEELAQFLFTTLDEHTFFNAIALHLKMNMKVDRVLLFKLTEKPESELISVNGQTMHDQQLTSLSHSQSYLLRTRKGYFSNQLARDPLFQEEAKQGIKAELCFPISCDQMVLGTIHLQIIQEENRTFTKEDMQSVLDLMGQLKNQLKNMKLYLSAKNLNELLQKTIEEKDQEMNHQKTFSFNVDSIKEKTVLGHSQVMTPAKPQ